jgi:hypothetical protein
VKEDQISANFEFMIGSCTEIEDLRDINFTEIIQLFYKTLSNKPLIFRPTKQRAFNQEQLHVSALTVHHQPTNIMFYKIQ